MTAVVVVPYRPDNGPRDVLWRYLQENFWCHLPFEVVVGENGGDGPFNRSAAINAAADRPWDVAVIADADTWVPARQLYDAVDNAEATSRLTSALTSVVEINRFCTEDILAGRVTLAGSFAADRVRTRELETQSSMLVVPRRLWDDIGGFDTRFEGWGGEDNSFWKAAEVLGDGVDRISGNGYHLWHPAAIGKNSGIGYKRNVNLWRRYEQVRTVDELRQVQAC